jgi:GntR family transcriptional regulator
VRSLAKHAKIRIDLERAIRSGELPPGASIPTERELAEEYGVSRATVQRAVTEMAQLGMVIRRRRAGTTVAPGAAAANLLRFTDPHSHEPETSGLHRVVFADVVAAGDTGEEVPGLGATEAVFHVRRIKDDEQGRPAGLETAVVPFSVAPRLLQEDLGPLTMLAYLKRLGVPVVRSRLYLTPMVAGPVEAEALTIDEGTALFHLRRESYLRDGSLAELFIGALSPHAFRLFVEQTVDPDVTPEEGQ